MTFPSAKAKTFLYLETSGSHYPIKQRPISNNGILTLKFFLISAPSWFHSEIKFFKNRIWRLLLHPHSERIHIDLICTKSSFIWPVTVDALTKENFNVFSNRFPFPRRILFATRIQLQFTPQTLHRAPFRHFTLFWRTVRFELYWFSYRGIFRCIRTQFYVRKLRYNSDYQSLASRVPKVSIPKTSVTS